MTGQLTCICFCIPDGAHFPFPDVDAGAGSHWACSKALIYMMGTIIPNTSSILQYVMFLVVHHWTKSRFEHKHDLSTNYNVHLFFVAKLGGGETTLHQLK